MFVWLAACGDDGSNGGSGADGITGPTGPAGPAGEQGPAGPQGPEGPAGPQGPEGPAGADAVTSFVWVDATQAVIGHELVYIDPVTTWTWCVDPETAGLEACTTPRAVVYETDDCTGTEYILDPAGPLEPMLISGGPDGAHQIRNGIIPAQEVLIQASSTSGFGPCYAYEPRLERVLPRGDLTGEIYPPASPFVGPVYRMIP